MSGRRVSPTYRIEIPAADGATRAVTLSAAMFEALRHATEHGDRLCYHRGGFWSPIAPGTRTMCWRHDWHCSAGTVQALVRRGVMRWTAWAPGRTGRYPIEATVPKLT